MLTWKHLQDVVVRLSRITGRGSLPEKSPLWGGRSVKVTSRLRSVRIAAITITVAAACAYLDIETRVFNSFEQPTYEMRLAMASIRDNGLTTRAQTRICVIGVSSATYRLPHHGYRPERYLPRAYYARLVRELTAQGAAAIGFDMVFDSPDPGDPAFAKAIRQSGRVVLACEDQTTSPAEVDPIVPMLLNAGAYEGHSSAPLDPGRQEIDRIAPFVATQGRLLPAFSVEVARTAQGLEARPLRRPGAAKPWAGFAIPVGPDDTFRIRYFGPRDTFKPIELADIITPGTMADYYRGTGFFHDKVVIVGDVTRINKDIQMTPLGQMPGVEVQANAVATLLNGRYLRDAPVWVEGWELILLASGASLIASVWRLRRAALLLALMLPVYFLFNTWLFVDKDIILRLFAPSLTIVVTALGVLLERGLTEEHEKTRMRALLHRYVSPQIASHIILHPEILGHAGRRTTGTVLFSDIRGFTALSERLAPDELVRRLNEYFDAMTTVILRHDGTVGSINGDCLLALFGVPVACDGHARQAVATAIEMQDVLSHLQKQWQARGLSVFDIGIGINTGEMVAGDVGGQQRASFTVYGLQVNIASRVESLNKDWNSRILITDATYGPVMGEVEVRGPRQATLKGVEGALDIYEVLGWKQTAGPPQE